MVWFSIFVCVFTFMSVLCNGTGVSLVLFVWLFVFYHLESWNKIGLFAYGFWIMWILTSVLLAGILISMSFAVTDLFGNHDLYRSQAWKVDVVGMAGDWSSIVCLVSSNQLRRNLWKSELWLIRRLQRINGEWVCWLFWLLQNLVHWYFGYCGYGPLFKIYIVGRFLAQQEILARRESVSYTVDTKCGSIFRILKYSLTILVEGQCFEYFVFWRYACN